MSTNFSSPRMCLQTNVVLSAPSSASPRTLPAAEPHPHSSCCCIVGPHGRPRGLGGRERVRENHHGASDGRGRGADRGHHREVQSVAAGRLSQARIHRRAGILLMSWEECTSREGLGVARETRRSPAWFLGKEELLRVIKREASLLSSFD